MNFAISENLIKNDGGEYVSYGIEYYDDDGTKRSLPDICTDKSAVESFVGRLNRNDASPVHILELTDDFLAGLYG
ncbi:MAG: hypothetical protein J1F64_01610 [Oscillospiraceae bacterium]|nr:hypothetical protein [Oscillospiraceae bacterium]